VKDCGRSIHFVELDPHAEAEPRYWFVSYMIASSLVMLPLAGVRLFLVFDFETGGNFPIGLFLGMLFVIAILGVVLCLLILSRNTYIIVIFVSLIAFLQFAVFYHIVNGIVVRYDLLTSQIKYSYIFSAVVGLYFFLIFISCIFIRGGRAERRFFAEADRAAPLRGFARVLGVPVGILGHVLPRRRAVILLLFLASSILFAFLIEAAIGIAYGAGDKFRLLDSYCTRILTRSGVVITPETRQECWAFLLSRNSIGRQFFYVAAALAAFWLLRRSARSLFVSSMARLRPDQLSDMFLYLRPFTLDRARLPFNWANALVYPFLFGIRTRRFDDMVLEECAFHAPAVCIEDPYDAEARYGPIKLALDHSEWQQAVSGLIKESRRVILCLGNTEGIRWEIHRLVEGGHLDKLAFCVSPTAGDDGGLGFNRTAVEAAFAQAGLSCRLDEQFFGAIFMERELYVLRSARRDIETYRMFIRMACRLSPSRSGTAPSLAGAAESGGVESKSTDCAP